MEQKHNLHALVFPFPLQGHLNPAINLAIGLASKGLAVTFANFEFHHIILSMAHNKATTEFDQFCEARKAGFNIGYGVINGTMPKEFHKFADEKTFCECVYRDSQPFVDEFIAKVIMSDPDSTYFLVVDTFFTWATTLAEKHNLVLVSFWTQPAMVFSLAYHIELVKEKGHFPLKENIEEDIDYIPGIESLNTRDFVSYYQESNRHRPTFEFVIRAFNLIKKADFVLHNTVQELESSVLLALNKHQQQYAIGPILFNENIMQKFFTKTIWPETDCTYWVQSKDPGSVLYVSFGSLVPIDKQLVEELAYGLILSQVNFIWVTRDQPLANHLQFLPNGFKDEIKDRGLMIPWCNQIQTLSNPAIGGFLTHCGWNSVIESIWCGVPMLCYPVIYDQPTNRKLVVDDWKIGIDLCDGKKVDRNDVARKIKSLIETEHIKTKLKRRIRDTRDLLKNAIEPDGSSERNFEQFITNLKEKHSTRSAKQESV